MTPSDLCWEGGASLLTVAEAPVQQGAAWRVQGGWEGGWRRGLGRGTGLEGGTGC